MKTAIAILSHLMIIIGGVRGYFYLSAKIENSSSNPPKLQLLLIFIIYSGLFLIIIHALTWSWSGIASLFTFGSIILFPIVSVAIVFSLRKHKNENKISHILYMLGLNFIPIALLLILGIAYFISYFDEIK